MFKTILENVLLKDGKVVVMFYDNWEFMEVYEYLVQDLEVVVVVFMLNVSRCCLTNLSLKYSVTTKV